MRRGWNTKKVINVASVPHRSPFRYPGGKTWLVPYIRCWLRSVSPAPSGLVEPFAGGAIVGLSALFEGLVKHLTLVEKDEDVAAVWRTIVDGNSAALIERILTFRLTRESVETLLNTPAPAQDVLESAFVTILRNRVQHGGIMAPGASLIKNGENGKGLKSRWYPETLAKRIKAIETFRKDITFLLEDGVDYIRRNTDRTDVVFFIDPPYTKAGKRLYRHSELDHKELFSVASKIRGDFLITYDDSTEIKSLALRFGFAVRSVVMKNTHHEIMKELLIAKDLAWLNRVQPAFQESFLESDSVSQVAPQ